jgi:hypothetical protein
MLFSDVLKSLEEKFTFRKKATFGGIPFEIALINYEQDQMINSIPDEGESPLSFYEKTRAQILSYAIVNIKGEEIPSIVEVTDGNVPVTKEKAIYVRELLKKLPPKVVEQIFEVYIDFKEEIDNRLSTEVEYKWYKTPEQRKEERDKKEREEKNISEEQKLPDENPIVFTKVEEKNDEQYPGN